MKRVSLQFRKTNSNLQILDIDKPIGSQLLKRYTLLSQDPYRFYQETALESGEILKEELSFGVCKGIEKFSKGDGSKGVLLLKGLPISHEALPLTPSEDGSTNGKDFLSERLLLGMAHLLGATPYINVGEKDGRVIHQIIPKKGHEHELSGLGSSVPFDFHTENIHEASPPHYLILLCLKGEAEAKTTYYYIDDLVSSLPNKVVGSLLKNRFEFRTGPSYNTHSKIQGSVLSLGSNGGFQARYNSSENRLVGLCPESEGALLFVRNWLKEDAAIHSVSLQQGDCLIIDNRRALHGRTSFRMSDSAETRRWLQRVYLRKI